ncbi:UNVERIFIED_CONTAM: hypothetical protein PYX00_000129 [Menopon gallinae]|uniref:Kazal-like domain-containing protein n=1 Tax=Menopon gallinae TaxID=328185 RepID=A0AAW2I989_9NEOP
MNKNGRCTDVLAMNISKEDCCRKFTNENSAWSEEDLDSGRLFFLRALGGGVPCLSCRSSCTGVVCGQDKKCVMRNGRPKCVCSPCKGKGRRQGPVCGTDGNSYANICRLKKQACRKKTSMLTVAYNGYCQSSCDKIQCPEGKFCLVDQNLTPHCVRCPTCPESSPDPNKLLCGSDGVTYDNVCHLRHTACTTGKAIPVAYKGPCKEKPTCGNIDCRPPQLCLTEPETGQPRCVTCDMDCPRPDSRAGQRRELGGPICGTNNKTYHSWCHMKKDGCDTGIVIETKSPGVCPGGGNDTVALEHRLGFS